MVSWPVIEKLGSGTSSLRQALASPSVRLVWSFVLLSHIYDGMQVYHYIYSIF